MPQIYQNSDSPKIENLIIRPFQSADQQASKALILHGLGERFGMINPDLNPDLDDINATYIESGFLFVVCEIDSALIGTGALVTEDVNVGRIVRVSVANSHRQRGIGRLITDYLIAAAPKRGYSRVVVETNEDWFDALHLYQRCGFMEYDRRNGEVHMRKNLLPNI